MRNYFGKNFAFYFAFAGSFTQALHLPSVAGIGFFLGG
jgi:hypothetical protein